MTGRSWASLGFVLGAGVAAWQELDRLRALGVRCTIDILKKYLQRDAESEL